MEHLNKLIKKRANDRLNKEISELCTFLKRNKMFEQVEMYKVQVDDEGPVPLRSFFWDNNDEAGNIIRKRLLQKYEEEEAERFVKKVDSLQEQINELQNNQQED